MRSSHSRECLARWVAATWLITAATLTIYLIAIGSGPALWDGEIAVILAICLGTSFVAVAILSRRGYGAVAVAVTTAVGFGSAYAWSLLKGNTGAEEGTIFMSAFVAILGAISALAAWLVLRTAHRQLSRDSCRGAAPNQATTSSSRSGRDGTE